MSEPTAADFFNYFQKQSEAVYGSPADSNYQSVPNGPLSEDLDELRSRAVQSSTPNIVSVNPTPSAPVVAAPAASTAEPTKQVFSHYPTGKVPPGFSPAVCCACCVHFCSYYSDCGSLCNKHDYPVSCNYTCDDFTTPEDYYSEEWDSDLQVYSSEFDLMSASDEHLEMLADIVPLYKEKNIEFDLASNKLYIFSEPTAALAVSLRDYLKKDEKKPTLMKLASRFAPEAVSKAALEDKEKLKVLVPTKQPTKPALFKLAAATSSQEDVYQTYESLYRQRYSDSVDFYVSPEAPSQPEVEEQNKEVYSDLGGASISSATYSGEGEASLGGLPLYNTLYGLAQKRVESKSKKKNISFSDQDVLKEYERVLKARGKLYS